MEFGATSNDDIELKTTFDATTKQWNILTRQISCTAKFKLVKLFAIFTWSVSPSVYIIYLFVLRAPPDCVQYFTGVAGNIKSYNFGNQILQGQSYGKYKKVEKFAES